MHTSHFRFKKFFTQVTTVLTIVMLMLTAMPVTPAFAASAVLDPWVNISSSTPNNNTGTVNAGNLTVSAGTDRVFVVGVCAELDGANTMTALSASLGATALTQIGSTGGINAQEHCYLGYLKNSQIPAGSNALTVPYNINGGGDNVTGIHVRWATYSGIDQTNPIFDSNANYNGGTNVTFGQQIDFLLDGLTFYVAANGGSNAAMTLPATFTQRLSTISSGHSSYAASITTAPHAANGNYAAATSVAFTGTTSNRSALVVASLRPSIPVAPTSFSSANNTTFTVGVPAASGSTFTVTANGSPAPTYSIQAGTLPSGVTLSAAGVLSGTPASGTVNTYPVTIRATNASGTLDQAFTLTIAKAPAALAITSDLPDPSLVGQNVTINFSITSANNTITPSGNVTVGDGVNSCNAPVTGAASPFTGSCMVAFTTPGNPRILTANYLTDANFNASSDTENHVVQASFPITVDTGAGGMITPPGTVGPNVGSVSVVSGANQTFDITPSTGYVVLSVEQNLTSGAACNATVGRVNSLTFNNVTGDRRICATFDSGWSRPNTNVNPSVGNAWGNPTGGNISDNSRATAPNFFLPISGSIDYATFNIPTIPTGSTIDGIEIALEGTTTASNISVSILRNGIPSSSQATTFVPGGREETQILGGPNDQWGLTGWDDTHFTNGAFRVRISAGNNAGFSIDQVQVKVHYRQPTTLVVSAATGNYGGTVDLTAALTTTVGGTPISGKTVNFFLNGNAATPIGSAVTDINGVATLNNVDLSGINAGTYPGAFNTSGVGASYAGTAAGVLPGYLTSNAANTLTVNKATLTVTANDKTREYGLVNPALDAAITGFVNGETLATSGVTGSPACTTAAVVTSPVNAYPITCAIGTLISANYNFTFVAGTLSVTQANLLITASDDTMVYGGTVPTITPVYTGLRAGDLAPATSPTCSTTATSASPVGSYPSTCAGAVDPNYNITYAAGNVTV
ncbi:MAG: MBG domain-containing protein, partial [Chloroflexota bacterium]